MMESKVLKIINIYPNRYLHPASFQLQEQKDIIADFPKSENNALKHLMKY